MCRRVSRRSAWGVWEADANDPSAGGVNAAPQAVMEGREAVWWPVVVVSNPWVGVQKPPTGSAARGPTFVPTTVAHEQ
jgi:hypothetical protein